MDIRLIKPWRDHKSGEKIDVGEALGMSLVRRKIAKAVAGPPRNKAENAAPVEK